MTIHTRTTTANSALSQYVSAIDAGPSYGTVKIYSGSMPSTPETAATGTLLAELTLAKPCGTVANKTLTFAAIARDNAANASGTAGYFRIADSAGNAILDGDVGITGSAAVLKLNTVAIAIDGPVEISSFVLTIG